MSGKNVLLIGASGGLGKHILNGLADAGYNLALHFRSGEQNLTASISEIKKQISSDKDV